MYDNILLSCDNGNIPEEMIIAGEFRCIDNQWYGYYDASLCGDIEDYKKPYIVTSIFVSILYRLSQMHIVPVAWE